MTKTIYEQLRQVIVSGGFKPEVPLVETVLAEQFGVSRTPVREALAQLVSDGLIERNGRSFTVAARSPEQILEIYEVRILLEGAAAQWAATRRSELDLNRLARAQKDMQNCPDGDSRMRKETNMAFHTQVWRASHNATVIEMLDRITVHLNRFPETTLDFPGRWEAALKEHDELIVAIVAQDADLAYEIATRHMSSARNIRLQIYS